MDLSKVITGLLSKAYKLDNGEIAELLKDGEGITEDTILDLILEKDTARVASIKKSIDTTGKFQEGYAKAKKEERSAFEKELKEKLGVESELTGVELVEDIVAKKAEKGAKIANDEDVKKHPVYQALDTRFKADVKAKEDEWKEKYTSLESTYQKKEKFGSIKEKALSLLDGMKPVLPDDTEVANTWKSTFVGALEGYEFEEQGSKVIVMKDGKVVDDSHGNTLTLEELVKNTAPKFFVFQKNNGGSNGGGQGQQGGGSNGGAYPAGISKPKTFEDLEKIMNDTTLKTEDKAIVMETWDKENPNG